MIGKTVSRNGDLRLRRYLDAVALEFLHSKGADAMRDYCTGLLLPARRKNVELMAARLAPSQVSAKHQSLHHFVSKADWDDAAVLARMCQIVSPVLQRHGVVNSWIIDSVAVAKQGRHSVGTARQCGSDGRMHGCQVAVTLSIASQHASLPVAFRLFLPREWTDDRDRCRAAGVPDDVVFRTRSLIALDQISQAVAAGIPAGVVVGDEEYGDCAALRGDLVALGIPFVLAVSPSTIVSDTEDPAKRVCVETLAATLPTKAWRQHVWPGGERPPPSHFAALPVRVDGSDPKVPPWWLLIERSMRAPRPERYWLSNLPATASLRTLVRAAKARLRTKQDHKQRIDTGLGHYEGRGWRGFHHHGTLSVVAYGFLVAERCSVRVSQRFTGDQISVPDRPFGFRSRS